MTTRAGVGQPDMGRCRRAYHNKHSRQARSISIRICPLRCLSDLPPATPQTGSLALLTSLRSVSSSSISHFLVTVIDRETARVASARAVAEADRRETTLSLTSLTRALEAKTCLC